MGTLFGKASFEREIRFSSLPIFLWNRYNLMGWIYQWFQFKNEKELLTKLAKGWEFRCIHPHYNNWLMRRYDQNKTKDSNHNQHPEWKV